MSYKCEILADSIHLNLGKRKKGFPSKNLIGLIFGKLTVVEYLFKSKWKCKCVCGNYTIVRTSDLNNGNSQGCKECTNRKADTGFNRLYYKYKNRSSKYTEPFDISIEKFKELTKSGCVYCGVNPYKTSTSSNTVSIRTRDYSAYLYNGLDRIDSSRGYLIENVVPCCEICNKAKRDMSIDDFKRWIDRLVKFNDRNNE